MQRRLQLKSFARNCGEELTEEYIDYFESQGHGSTLEQDFA